MTVIRKHLAQKALSDFTVPAKLAALRPLSLYSCSRHSNRSSAFPFVRLISPLESGGGLISSSCLTDPSISSDDSILGFAGCVPPPHNPISSHRKSTSLPLSSLCHSARPGVGLQGCHRQAEVTSTGPKISEGIESDQHNLYHNYRVASLK